MKTKLFLVLLFIVLTTVSLVYFSEDLLRNSVHQNPFVVSVTPAEGECFIFGVKAKTIFTITNLSEKQIILHEIIPSYPTNEQTLLYGYPDYFVFEKTDGKYGLRVPVISSGGGPPEEYLEAGLMLPGQTIKIEIDYQAVSKSEAFIFRYSFVDQHHMYTVWSIDETDDSRYELREQELPSFSIDNWRKLDKLNPILKFNNWGSWALRGRNRNVRSVYVPTLTNAFHSQTITCSFNYNEPHFFLEDATQSAYRLTGIKHERSDLCHSAHLKGYVINEKDYSWLLSDKQQKSIGQKMIKLDNSIVRKMDWSYPGNNSLTNLHILLEPISSDRNYTDPDLVGLWKNFNIEDHFGKGGTGKNFYLNKEKFHTFFESAAEHNLTLIFDENYHMGVFKPVKLATGNSDIKVTFSIQKKGMPILKIENLTSDYLLLDEMDFPHAKLSQIDFNQYLRGRRIERQSRLKINLVKTFNLLKSISMNFALIGPGGSYHINNFPRIANETMEIQVCYRVIPINNINTLYRVSDYQQKPHGRMERFYYSHRNHTKVKYQSLTSNDKISTMDMWQGVVSFEDKKKNMKSWSQLFTVPIVNVKQPSGN